MTYPFKFPDTAPPTLTVGRSRTWGPLTATEVHATPGRYPGQVFPDHRLIFYITPDVPTDCSCEGVSQRRIQAPYDFDIVPAGASGVWEDHADCDMVSVRLAPRLLQSFGAIGAAGRQILSKPQVRRIVEFVEENLDGELTLEQVADVAGMSIPHLTTLFRRTMGQSVHAYVMERRVQRARALLLEHRLSIAQVALETGFAHQSHLARWMRRLLGVTPSEILRA